MWLESKGGAAGQVGPAESESAWLRGSAGALPAGGEGGQARGEEDLRRGAQRRRPHRC